MPLNLQNLRVLIVDDSKPIRDLLSFVLEGLGVGKISVADNGDRGFDVFQRDMPDIVFVDWDMEPTNGLTLAKRIRTEPGSVNPQVPIIMISGYSAVFRVIGARECGITEFMTKPFTADAIAKRIASVINNPRDFIKYTEYVGPDRRRRDAANISEDRRARN